MNKRDEILEYLEENGCPKYEGLIPYEQNLAALE